MKARQLTAKRFNQLNTAQPPPRRPIYDFFIGTVAVIVSLIVYFLVTISLIYLVNHLYHTYIKCTSTILMIRGVTCYCTEQ